MLVVATWNASHLLDDGQVGFAHDLMVPNITYEERNRFLTE